MVKKSFILDTSGRIKALYKLGISDSYVAACALEDEGELVTKDKDYKVLEKEVSISFL